MQVVSLYMVFTRYEKTMAVCYQLNVLQLIRLCRYFVDVLRQSGNGNVL